MVKYSKKPGKKFFLFNLFWFFWFVIRTGTKPTRITYPCQKAAAIQSSMFLIYLSAYPIIHIKKRLGLFRQELTSKKIIKTSLTIFTIFSLAFSASRVYDLYEEHKTLARLAAIQAAASSLALFNKPAWAQGEKSDVFGIMNFPAPSPLPNTTHLGVEALIDLLKSRGTYFYKTTAHPDGIIDSNDVVLIKINAQWCDRLGTNTDVLKGLIQAVLDHPDGFTGEIVVVENGQFQKYRWYDCPSYNAEDTSQSFDDVVLHFSDNGYPVSRYNWALIGHDPINYVDEYNEPSPTNNTDGYVDLSGGPGSHTEHVTYPKFSTTYTTPTGPCQGDCPGTNISLKLGIWDGSAYDNSRLKFINVPVLKGHSQMGVTASIKHYMGVLATEVGSAFTEDTPIHVALKYDALMGKMRTHVRDSDLDIIDATYMSKTNYVINPSNPVYSNYSILASTDGVALDYYASKYFLYEATGESEHDPDEIGRDFYNYLNDSMYELLDHGIFATMDEADMNFYVYDFASPTTPYSKESYTNKWKNEFRIDTNFGSYVSGNEFDFTGYFNNLITKYTKPFARLPYDNTKEYLKNIPIWEKGVNWTVPSYEPGDSFGNLRTIADFIVYQDVDGIVYYRDTSTGIDYGDGDTYAEEIEGALNALNPSDTTKIVYIDSAPKPYVVYDRIWLDQDNLIVSGDGWGTIVQLNETWSGTEAVFTSPTATSHQNLIVKDFVIDGNYPNHLPNDEMYTNLKPKAYDKIAILNMNLTRGRKMGAVIRSSNNTYFLNNWVYDNCWNGAQPTIGYNHSLMGNYIEGFGDVGISTWSSYYVYILNNICFQGNDWVITSPYVGGGGSTSWGIGFEGGSSSQTNSRYIYVRNNVANNNTATGGNQYGRVGIAFGGPEGGHEPRDIIVDNNTVKFNFKGIKAFPLSTYRRNALFVNNVVSDNIDAQWWIREDDHWIGRPHSSCTAGYVAFEINEQISNPNSPPERECALDIVSETANNLTFTIESLNHPYLADSSSIEVYHTGIDGDWRIDFHNGTIVDAMPYYDQITNILTYEVTYESNYVTMSIYSITPETTTTTTLPIRISGQLMNETDYIQAEVIAYNPETSQVNASDTTDSSGNYNLGVWPDVYDLRFNILNFFIPNFWIKLISLDVFSDIVDVVNYVTGYPSENKVSFTVDITANQEIQLYSDEMPNRILKNGTMLQNVSSYSELTNNTWYYNSSEDRLYMIVNPTVQPGVWADNGSAVAIQAAVDEVAAMGGGNVHIPAGTWNFVEIGEPWKTVTIPAGVNLFGATSPKDANGFNQGFFDSPDSGTWSTILIMPYDVASGAVWFNLGVPGSSAKNATRFSDIKLVGYRSIDPNSTTFHRGIVIYGIIDFRIDHCMFEHTSNGGVSIPNYYQQNMECSGVIDHSKFINLHGYDVLADYTKGNIGYGVSVGRAYNPSGGGAMPYEPTMDILGKYNNHIVFIEDCYFSKWRHCVASGHGGYYVFRYNLVDRDFAHFSLDVHGLRDMESGRAGGRGCEVYENIFQNVETTDEDPNPPFRGVMQIAGGSGVFFNNYIDSSYSNNRFVCYNEEYIKPPLGEWIDVYGNSIPDSIDPSKRWPRSPQETIWRLKDFYMWSKKGPWNSSWYGTLPNSSVVVDGITYTVGFKGVGFDRHVEAYWNRSAGNEGDPNYPNVDPSWSIAGYTPYPYPHPLTV